MAADKGAHSRYGGTTWSVAQTVLTILLRLSHAQPNGGAHLAVPASMLLVSEFNHIACKLHGAAIATL